MSYINRAVPFDKQQFNEQRNVLIGIPHTFVLNTFAKIGNGVVPLPFSTNSNGFTDNGDSSFTYNGLTSELFEIDVVIQGFSHGTAGATVINGAMFVNNVIVPNSTISHRISSTANDPVIYTYKHSLTLNPNDIVDFRVANISRSESGSFRQYSFIIKTILNLL